MTFFALQELYDPRGEKPVHMVDGWNAWYFKDAVNLPRVWPGIGANRSDVLDLWLGFLRYYYDGFDDKASSYYYSSQVGLNTLIIHDFLPESRGVYPATRAPHQVRKDVELALYRHRRPIRSRPQPRSWNL